MWVRLREWMIYDQVPPLPRVGSVLTGLGLRVRGEVTPALADSPDGIVEIPGNQPHEVMYQLTGRMSEPRDFEMDTGRGSQHAGVEFVLTVGPDRFQVQSDQWARDVPPAQRVAVRGHLAVVGAYEWDDFGLDESRSDWLVKAVASADYGDTMLDVVASDQRPRTSPKTTKR